MWVALFVLTMAPPVVWGVASAAENGELEAPAPSNETILRTGKNVQPMLMAASIARSQDEQSVTATAARRQRTVESTPIRLADGAAPVLMAQASGASSAEAAPGFETGSVLVRPTAAPADGEASADSTKEYYRPIERATGAVENADEGVATGASPAVAPANGGVDYNKLRAAPPDRRMRNAMHKVAASTAAALSSQNAFGSSFEPKRFESSPAGAAFERSLHTASETVEVIPGVRLEGVTLSTGYSSNGIPGSRLVGFGNAVGSDYDMGASATFAYRNSGRSSNFTVRYTPQHVRRARLSEWNSTNHNLMISTSKELGRRWTVGGNVGANETGIERFFINQPEFHYLENRPGSFEELVQQVQSGQLTDDEFAAALTGSPIIDKPAERRLNLGRALSATASGHLSYAYSPRLTLTLDGSLQRYQLYDDEFIDSRRNEAGAFYFNRMTSSRAGLSGRYRLSARRDIGFSQGVSVRGSVGPYGSRRAYSSEVFFHEKIGRSWTYELRGGLGSTTGTNRLALSSADPNGDVISPADVRGTRQTWIASGSLGYEIGQQRISLSAGRRVGDAFNFGNNASINARLGWTWTPRRAPWSFHAGGSYFQSDFQNAAVNGVRGLRSRLLTAGVNRVLTPSTALNTTFQFGYFHSPYSGLFTNNQVSRVQVAFVWRPAQSER